MTYIFSNGDVADGSHVNDNFNKLNKLTNEKAINDVSATNSGVLAGSSQKLIDKFLDSNGQNNTVDTGTTTGIYDSVNKAYICNFAGTGAAANQNGEATMASSDSNSASTGYVMTVNSNCTLISVTKHASCTSTRARLRAVGGSDIATATFSGNVATFSSEQKLIAGITYYIETDNSGAAQTRQRDTTPSYPYTNTLITFPEHCSNASPAGVGYAYNIISVQAKAIAYSDSIVQSAVTTIPTGMTKVFVTPLMYEALATGDSITADVSIDNGAHYTTGIPINTWTPITSANGTQLIVKANLLTGSGVSTPKISGWRVLME